MLNDA